MTTKKGTGLLDTIITANLLRSQAACQEATKEVAAITPPLSVRKLAVKLNRADWLLWELARLGLDRKLLVLCACDCAETAKLFWPKGKEEVCRTAIETARRWAEGKATIKEVRADAAAADAADAAGKSKENAHRTMVKLILDRIRKACQETTQ